MHSKPLNIVAQTVVKSPQFTSPQNSQNQPLNNNRCVHHDKKLSSQKLMAIKITQCYCACIFLVLDTPKLQSGESLAFSFFVLKSYNYLGFEIDQAIFLDSCSQGKKKW